MSISPYLNASHQRSFTLTTFDRVNQSPSQSKYTFSKADRFPTIKANNEVGAYSIPSTISSRAASLGYGKKEIFKETRSKYKYATPANERNLDSPSPDKYNMKSVFDFKDNMPQQSAFGKVRRTFCFGAGREDFTKTVYNLSTIAADPIVPGPGTYSDGTKLIGVNTRKTTLKERKFYLDDDEMARKLAIPGPGTYEESTKFDKVGVYPISQMT